MSGGVSIVGEKGFDPDSDAFSDLSGMVGVS